MEVDVMPPQKFKTLDGLQSSIDRFFAGCDEQGKPYTITGLALALDTTRETLMDVENSNGPYNKDYSDAIKKAKQRCQNYAEEQMFTSRNPAGAIFALKNYGWRDTQDVRVAGDLKVQIEGFDPTWVAR